MLYRSHTFMYACGHPIHLNYDFVHFFRKTRVRFWPCSAKHPICVHSGRHSSGHLKALPPYSSLPLSPSAAHACPMTAHPTLQHDDVSGHLLVLSMAKLWKGGAAAAAALCRHLSLFGMCTVVRGDRLHGLVTDHRGLSREHGQDDAKACRRRRRRRISASDVQSASNCQSRLPRRLRRPQNVAHFGLSKILAR